MGLGLFDEALQCFERVIELEPGIAAAKGLISVNKLLGLDEVSGEPGIAVAWHNKGLCFVHLERFDEALPCFEKAVELGAERMHEALGCFEKVVELNPENTNAWYIKARIEDELGRGQDARHSYQRFIGLAPKESDEELTYARQRLRELEGK